MKKLFLALLFFCLCACAKAPSETAPPMPGDTPWDKMAAISSQDPRPCRIQFSLRFGQENDTRRVTGILWSNDNENIRLDVMAGVGTTVAKIMDNPGEFLLLSPQENKAYTHAGANRPLLRIGSPLPFDLSQLAQLLSGRYIQVYGKAAAADESGDGNVVYDLEKPAGGALEVSRNGLPQLWRTPNWSLRFRYSGEETLPDSLRLTGKGGKIAILLVKSREFPAEPFTAAQMNLAKPDGCLAQPLSSYNPARMK